MLKAALFLIIVCAGCELRQDVERECVSSLATLEEKIGCGTAKDPRWCWKWIREAKCTGWRFAYTSWNGHKWNAVPCDLTNGDALKLCMNHGYRPE